MARVVPTNAPEAPAASTSDDVKPFYDDAANIDWSQPPAVPVVVEIVLAIKKLEVINTHTEALLMKATLEVYWDDPRLSGYPQSKGMPQDIWRPQFLANMGLKMSEAEAYKQLPDFYKKEPQSDGRLKMHIGMSLGEAGWDLNEDLQRMRAFPFDGARVDLSIILGGQRRDTNEDVLISLQRANMPSRVEKCGPVQSIDWNCPRRSGEYQVSAVSYGVSHHYIPQPYKHSRHGPDAQRVAYVLSIHVERSPYFYLWKGMVPLFSCALFAYITFTLEPDDLGNRMAIVSALFLTMYAIQYVTIERLPRSPFATVFDNVCQSVIGSLVAMVIGQCIAYRIGRRRTATDFSFDPAAAERVDLITMGVVLCYLLFYSVGFCCVYRVYRAKRTSGAWRTWHEGPEQRNRWPVIEGYSLKLNDAFQRLHGKTYLGSGERVACGGGSNSNWTSGSDSMAHSHF